jgi:arginase
MTREIAVVGAPSNIGIRPYEDGEPRHLNRAPEVLRRRDLIARLGAIDFGDVMPPPYRDYAKPVERARNEAQVAAYSRLLAARVGAAMRGGRFAVVIGGDCSIVLGCLLGARRRAGGPVGLTYVDAHADFATPHESPTGSVSGMSLALASGRGDSPLAALGGRSPLVNGRRVALLGRRDGLSAHGHPALAASSILDVPTHQFLSHAANDLAAAALARVLPSGTRGFWIHLDVDVLDAAVMSAVDSPTRGGLMPDQLVQLLTPLVQHPQALGLDVSIYDPALDPDRSCARRLVNLLAAVFDERDREA